MQKKNSIIEFVCLQCIFFYYFLQLLINGCFFSLPFQIPHFQDVNNSFSKLMRACSPSGSSSSTKYLSQVEDSEWMNQLSSVIQLSTAISHLIDAQGSSVMVCLEDGTDTATQVSILHVNSRSCLYMSRQLDLVLMSMDLGLLVEWLFSLSDHHCVCICAIYNIHVISPFCM